MDNKEKICHIMDEIINLLLDFENETIQIINCGTDDILPHTQNRVSITNSIDERFRKIEMICAQMPDGEEIYKIIRHVSSYTSVESEHEDIFFKSQGVFSLVSRIKDSDVQAIDRINNEKLLLMKKIREINTGQSAKASKFKVGMDTSGSRAYLGGNKII